MNVYTKDNINDYIDYILDVLDEFVNQNDITIKPGAVINMENYRRMLFKYKKVCKDTINVLDRMFLVEEVRIYVRKLDDVMEEVIQLNKI